MSFTKRLDSAILNDNFYVGLAFFRVILSFLVLKNCIFYLPLANLLFGKGGIYPIENYVMGFKVSWFFSSLGLDHLALSLFSFPFFPTIYLIVCIVLFSLFLLGIGKNYVAVVCYLLLLNLMWRNPFILDGSDNVIQVTFPFLLLTNSFKYLTWNNSFSKLPTAPMLANWKVRTRKGKIARLLNDIGTLGIKIQTCFVYFFTGLAKMQGSLWINGTAVYYTMRVNEFRATSLNIPLTESHYFVVLATYFTLLWELAFIFLVWFRQTKIWVLVCGVMLHLGIWIFMRIDNFSWIMMGTYFLFLTDCEYKYLFKKTSKVKLYLTRRLSFFYKTQL